MTKTMEWPEALPDRTKLVRHYIMDKGWTYLQLADAVGVSRSTIAGVCYRAGIRKTAPKKAVISPRLPPEHPSIRLVASSVKEVPVDIMGPPLKAVPIEGGVWSPLPGIKAVHLTDATPRQCKWMVGHHLFCGADAAPDKVYCPTHCAVAYKDFPPTILKRRVNSQTSMFKVRI